VRRSAVKRKKPKQRKRLSNNAVRAETNPTASACWNDAEASASSDASASCYGAPEDVRVLAIVMAELKFVQIERQIFGADVVICPDDSALQERPEVFDVVRVNLAAHVFTCFVIDGLVREGLPQIAITAAFIGGDQADSIRDDISNEMAQRLGASVLDNLANHVALASDCADYRSLGGVGRSASVVLRAHVRVAIALFAPDVGFVNFNDAHQLPELWIGESGAQAMTHEPCGAVGAAPDHAMDLQSAHAFLAGQHQVQNLEPDQQFVIRVLENGPCDDGEPIGAFARSALLAFPRPRARLARVNLIVAAARATDAVRPALRHQVRLARGFIGKHPIKLRKRHLSGNFRFANLDLRVHH
jgi:hypothetical protein